MNGSAPAILCQKVFKKLKSQSTDDGKHIEMAAYPYPYTYSIYTLQTVQNSVLADHVTHMVTKNIVLHYFVLYIALFVECSLNIDEYR
jgi:hypothetical protein